jgi:hypothetical protein
LRKKGVPVDSMGSFGASYDGGILKVWLRASIGGVLFHVAYDEWVMMRICTLECMGKRQRLVEFCCDMFVGVDSLCPVNLVSLILG